MLGRGALQRLQVPNYGSSLSTMQEVSVSLLCVISYAVLVGSRFAHQQELKTQGQQEALAWQHVPMFAWTRLMRALPLDPRPLS